MRTPRMMLCLLLVAAACNGAGDDGRPQATRSKSPDPPKPVFCPLTGEQTSRDFPVGRPALGVKIENSTASRPQAGLEQADIVYEELAEGGITRFLAIYHCSDPQSLGPIRSARAVDPDILLEYAPVLFGYSGANSQVREKVRQTKGIADLAHGNHGDAYRRERGRSAPHNLFSSSDELRGLNDAKSVDGGPKIGLTFDPAATTTAVASPSPSKGSPRPGASASPSMPPPAPGASVSFSFSGNPNLVRYIYDAASVSYLRHHGNTAHRAASGEQIKAVNVLVLKVKVTEGTIRDAAGNLSPEIGVVGSGEAIIVRGGTSVVGKWSRPSMADKTKLTDPSGKGVLLLPGNTWIHLIPSDRQVVVQ